MLDWIPYLRQLQKMYNETASFQKKNFLHSQYIVDCSMHEGEHLLDNK